MNEDNSLINQAEINMASVSEENNRNDDNILDSVQLNNAVGNDDHINNDEGGQNEDSNDVPELDSFVQHFEYETDESLGTGSEHENDENDDIEDEIVLDQQISMLGAAVRQIENILSSVGNARILTFTRRNNANNDNEIEGFDTDSNLTVERFDTNLPVEHSYLGNMERVSGVAYFEPGKHHRLLMILHHSILFPGETLPMILPNLRIDESLLEEEVFGVLFSNTFKLTQPHLYGVTCQIYEKGTIEGDVVLKSRALQRFIVKKELNTNFNDLLNQPRTKLFANVIILPEIILPHPLSSIDLGSMNRFRGIDSMKNKLQQFQAATTIWPKFIYDEYDVQRVIDKAKQYLCKYKIESMPTDLRLLSYWFARNILLDMKKRMKLFSTDCVNIRMKIIEETLNSERSFCCKRCQTKIANGDSLFAMSKLGVQSNYCNPSGYIHETNTVYTVEKDNIVVTGPPSTEFSWFPGYSWQIIVCSTCSSHIGWKFVSTKVNLIPKKFYGLSGSSVIVKFSTQTAPEEQQEQEQQRNANSPVEGQIFPDFLNYLSY